MSAIDRQSTENHRTSENAELELMAQEDWRRASRAVTALLERLCEAKAELEQARQQVRRCCAVIDAMSQQEQQLLRTQSHKLRIWKGLASFNKADTIDLPLLDDARISGIGPEVTQECD